MTELSRSRQGSTVGQQSSDRRNNQVFACSQRLNFLRNSPKLSSLEKLRVIRNSVLFNFMSLTVYTIKRHIVNQI